MDYSKMDYRDRFKKVFGYTDKMLELDEIMDKSSDEKSKVKITDVEGKVYIGIADGYNKPDDEEDGYSTVTIETKNGELWCLGVNEIKSIEVVEG